MLGGRYFHECGPRDQEASSEGGSEGSRQRYPLLEHSDFRYPHPLLETKDSLAVRAQLSAAAHITLNEQVGALVLLRAGCRLRAGVRDRPTGRRTLPAQLARVSS